MTTGAKFTAAGGSLTVGALLSLAEGIGLTLSLDHALELFLAGLLGVVAWLIRSAWSDLVKRIEVARKDRVELFRNVHRLELQTRALEAALMFACPLYSGKSAEEMRRHLEEHLSRRGE